MINKHGAVGSHWQTSRDGVSGDEIFWLMQNIDTRRAYLLCTSLSVALLLIRIRGKRLGGAPCIAMQGRL